MAEPLPSPPNPPAPPTRETPPARVHPAGGGCAWIVSALRRVITFLLAATALAWLLRLLVDFDPVRGAWTLQVSLALASLLCAAWGGLHSRRHWSGPVGRLRSLLEEARAGEAPVAALDEVGGGAGPLVPLLKDLFRELREQRLAVARLNHEIRQRVAVRTDALERTIGSLRQQATRDPLTGLFNRRFLDQYLPQAVARALRGDGGPGGGRPAELCLLMIDVDHFKVLNDTLGHAAGDGLLKSIGQLIRSTVRGEDVAFRCGGDEFVVVLPGHDSRAGRALAERLTSLVDGLGRTLRVPKAPRLSIGLATLGGLGAPSAEALLAEADRDLYTVKAERHGLGGRAGGGRALTRQGA